MGLEIERKFLVLGQPWPAGPGISICQGYLGQTDQATVRVRVADQAAFLTVKGPTQGWSRSEFEYPIPVADALQLLTLCGNRTLEKRRHIVTYAGARWEIDEFLGRHAGLIVAEIELSSESQAFVPPPWLGREVSDDPRFRNSHLASPEWQWPTDLVPDAPTVPR